MAIKIVLRLKLLSEAVWICTILIFGLNVRMVAHFIIANVKNMTFKQVLPFFDVEIIWNGEKKEL